MIIIIDGYNVLKKIHGQHVSDMQKSAFVNLLGRYIKRRNHKILVMFDGGPDQFPSKEKQKGIFVWHSGFKQSDDDLIIAYAQEHKTQELLVVTLDREICQKVGECRVETIDPVLFYHKVVEVCEPTKTGEEVSTDTIIKMAQDSDEGLDALMIEAAGMKMPFKAESLTSTLKKMAPNGRLSKKERGYKKIIDKL